MSEYQAPDGSIHDDMNGEALHLLPIGCVLLTAAQADAIRLSRITPIVIQKVTMRQARLALLQAGHLANVQSAIAAMVGISGDAARITWEFSSTVERNNPLIAQLGTALNLTETQLNDLFTLAATK